MVLCQISIQKDDLKDLLQRSINTVIALCFLTLYESFTKEQMQELEEKGYLTEYTPKEVRKKIVVDKRILKGFELINQKELLKDVNCLVLIIHGNNDEEERLLYERSKAAMTLLSSDSKLEVIDGANHSFLEHFDIIVGLTTDWFAKNLY